MTIGYLDWIKISQIESLGITKELFFTVVIFLGIVGCYFILRPLSIILISIQSERLINFVISGLFFIVLFFIVILLIGEIEILTYLLFKVVLQALALFGLLLTVTQLCKQLIQKRRKV